jgi:hypothetical protein
MVNCSSNVHSVHIYKNLTVIRIARNKRHLSVDLSDTALFPRKKRDSFPLGNYFTIFFTILLLIITYTKVFICFIISVCS